MYDNGSSSQLELCLLGYSDEVNDGSCVYWAVVLWPVKVLILMQVGRNKEEEDSWWRDGREEDCGKVIMKLFRISHIKKHHSCPSHQHLNRIFQTLLHQFITQDWDYAWEGGGTGSKLLFYLRWRVSSFFFPPGLQLHWLRIGLISLAKSGDRVGAWAVSAGSSEEWDSLCSPSLINSLLYSEWGVELVNTLHYTISVRINHSFIWHPITA